MCSTAIGNWLELAVTSSGGKTAKPFLFLFDLGTPEKAFVVCPSCRATMNDAGVCDHRKCGTVRSIPEVGSVQRPWHDSRSSIRDKIAADLIRSG